MVRTNTAAARLGWAVLLVAGSLCPAFAQVPAAAQAIPVTEFAAVRATKVVNAIRTTGRMTLDGRLDEAAWQLAFPAKDFIQKLPNNGAPATERTEARFLYDDDNLYVGVTCFDSNPSRTLIKDLKEDFDFGGTDLVQVFIDSLHDQRSGFTLVVNPAGARRDTQVSASGTTNQDWDGVWDAKVSRDDKAWYVEYVIPFKTLRFSSSTSQEWGINVTRKMLYLNEEDNWAPVPIRFQGSRADLAGTLRGLENIRQGRNLKIKPFVIGGGTETVTRGVSRRERNIDGGFDAKFSLTPSLTLDATYRTDFAQVEADQQQVNLTRFNLFFPEKRDFFLENAGIFAFGTGNANSNNANNASNLVPFFSRRIGLSPSGTPIPIVGGARVSGKAGSNDIGVLAMRTEESGTTPANNYLVGRYKRNILRTGWLGGIVTDRQSNRADDYNRVYGPDLHLQFFQRLDIDSFLLRSDTPGKSDRNLARNFRTAWTDDEFTLSGEYNAVQTNFNPEAGFVRRGNIGWYSGDVAWKPLVRRSEAIRNLNFGASADYYKGENGKIETRTGDQSFGVVFENGGSATLAVNQTFDRLVQPFAIRSGVLIPSGDYQYHRYSATLNTGTNRKVNVTANTGWGDFWNGESTSAGGTVDVRPNYHLTVNLSYSRNRVDLPSGSFTTGLFGTRVLYGFSPRTFLNAFIQYNADTHQVSSNVRFNFTHHPLSDLYVVYNDRRDTSSGQLVERAIILKLTNLFNF